MTSWRSHQTVQLDTASALAAGGSAEAPRGAFRDRLPSRSLPTKRAGSSSPAAAAAAAAAEGGGCLPCGCCPPSGTSSWVAWSRQEGVGQV